MSGNLLDAIYAHNKPAMNSALIISMIFAVGLFTSIAIKDYLIGLYLEKGLINLKQKTIQILNNAKLTWLDRMHTGELSSLVTNDLNSLSGALRPVLIIGISWTFAQFVSIGYILYVNPNLTLIIFAFVPLISLIQWLLGKHIKSFRLKNLEAVGNMMSVASDCFGSHETVKSLGLEKEMLNRFESAQEKQEVAAANEIRIDARLTPFSLLCEWLPRITLLVAGGRMVLQGEMSIGQLMVFMALSYRTIKALSGLPDSFAALRRLSASCVRIAQVWEVPKEHSNGDVIKPVQNTPLLSLDHVRFSYNSDLAETRSLNDITFNVHNGEFIALVGESGCGKSTILKLIASLYEPADGTICFQGNDITRWRLESLRNRVAYVTQETFLFAGSIYKNITCGKTDINIENIRMAVEAAGLSSFINTLPQGLDTQIGERGIHLSGGQRQRISIARAVLTNSNLLLLDEATSALDKRTENEVISSLLSLPHKPAIIMAAHRLSAIRKAACIYIIDKGCIAEAGTHEQLKNSGGIYAGILSNIMEEEVEHAS